MRTSERLLVRLLKEAPFDIPDGGGPARLYHGRHQRSAGAWSWSLDLGPALAGSQHTMQECTQAARLDFDRDHAGGDWHITPANPIG